MFQVAERQVAAADDGIDGADALMHVRCLQMPDYFIANRKEPHCTPMYGRALAPLSRLCGS